MRPLPFLRGFLIRLVGPTVPYELTRQDGHCANLSLPVRARCRRQAGFTRLIAQLIVELLAINSTVAHIAAVRAAYRSPTSIIESHAPVALGRPGGNLGIPHPAITFHQAAYGP